MVLALGLGTAPGGGRAGEPVSGAILAGPPSEDDQLVLRVDLRRAPLSDALLAYQTGGRLLLPLQELALLLEFPILVREDGQGADGWFIGEERKFHLDLAAGTLHAGAQDLRLPPGSAAVLGREIYLDRELLARALPLDLDFNPSTLELAIRPREPLPADAETQRAAARLQLQRGGSPGVSDLVPVDTPYAALDWPMADVNLNLARDTGDGTAPYRMTYDVLATGDLLGTSARLVASGEADDAPRVLRLNLARHDPEAGLLGPLHATRVEGGDVDTPSRPLVAEARSGRGVLVGNDPFGLFGEFDRVTLQGDLRPGYEAELYRNGVLLDFAQPNAENRYEFRQVPLLIGPNRLTIVGYGPQGQRTEETRTYYIGPSLIPPGSLRYRAAVVQQGTSLVGLDQGPSRDDGTEGRPRALTELAYGLSRSVSLGGSLALLPLRGGATTAIASTDLRGDLAGFFLTGSLAASALGGFAIGSGVQTRLGPWDAHLDSAGYLAGFRSDRTGRSDKALTSETQALLTRDIARIGPLVGANLELSGVFRSYQDGAHGALGTRLSGLLGRVSLSNSLAYEVGEDAGGLVGSLQASGNLGVLRARSTLAYESQPEPQLTSARLDLTYPLDQRTDLEAAVERGLGLVSGTTYSLRLGRLFEPAKVNLISLYDDRRASLYLGIGVSFALMRDPASGRPRLSARPVARYGAVAARTFLDRNLDGRFDQGDEPLAGVDLIADGSGGRSLTDAAGRTVLSRLPTDRWIGVRPRSGSLEDPGYEPVQPGYRFVPRAGKVARLEIPVIPTGEVGGTVSLERGRALEPAANVALQLVRDGAAPPAIAAETRSEFDGVYSFEKVRPGHYWLRVDPDQARRVALKVPLPLPVEITAAGEQLAGLDLTVSRPR